MKVKTFRYEAYTKERVLEKGTVHAASQNEVILLLRSRSLVPVRVTETSNRAPLFRRQQVSRQEVMEFTEGLTTLIAADVPIDRALYMLRSISKKESMRYLVDTLRRQVKEGKGLAEAMMLFANVFPRMYIYMIQAGEENGILPDLLPRLERLLNEEEETRNKVISSLIYPVILAVVGLLSVIMLLTFVVPKFAIVFQDTGAALPPSTAFLLGLSSVVRKYGWLLPILPAAVFFILRTINRSEELRERRDLLLLRLPVAGLIIIQKNCAGFSRTMGALLNAGVPLARALTTTRSILDNVVLRREVEEIEEMVRKGASLARAFAGQEYFPDIMAELIAVGEESGKTADIFFKLAETFDKNVKKQTERLVAMLEPAMILLLGLIIGGIVVIMLSSVMSMNDIGM